MKKHAYRAKNINQLSLEKVWDKLGAGRVIVAVDVAKREFLVGLAGTTGEVVEFVRFTHPVQTPQFLELLEGLRGRGACLEVALEPTGTYGDALVAQLLTRGVETFAVSPKRCHDAAELYDGVPSLHDAKATMIMARLHVQGLSKPWVMPEQARRQVRAAVERREIYADPMRRNLGRLEGVLARHWPEFGTHLNVCAQKTALALLAEYPGPQAVAAADDEAAAFMVRRSHSALPVQKIDGVVACAKCSLGVLMLEQESKLLQELARQTLELWREVERVDAQIVELVGADAQTSQLAATVGPVTAGVLVALLGPASSYPSAGAYVKAMGLNLKEHSSGTSKKPGTGLHITKRAPGLVRKYMYLATLRLLQVHPLMRQWYEARGAYKAGQKVKAVTAVMRKLARALWHVGQGKSFDVDKLFDKRHLTALTLACAAQGN